MNAKHIICFLQIVFAFGKGFSYNFGASSDELNCGACLTIVEEVIQEINEVDPKKLIQVGSYRIDPSGNQKLNKIPYAKSESHLYEVFENVCSQMSNYGLAVHEGRGVLIRKVGHSHKVISGVSVDMTGELSTKLKYACDSFLEEHEEEVIESFKSEGEDYHEKLCLDATEACTTQNITDLEALKSKAIYIHAPPSPKEDKEESHDGDDDDGDDGDDDDERTYDDDTDDGGDDAVNMDKEEL